MSEGRYELTTVQSIRAVVLTAMIMAAALWAAPPEGTHLNIEDQFNTFGLDTTNPQLVDINGDGQLWPRLPPWDSVHLWGFHNYAWNRGNILAWCDLQDWIHENYYGESSSPFGTKVHELSGASTLKLHCIEVCDTTKRMNTMLWAFACGMITTERSYHQQYGSFEVRARFNLTPGVQWSICLVNPLWTSDGIGYYDDGVDYLWRFQGYAEQATSRIWIADVIGDNTNSVTMGTYNCDYLSADQGGNIGNRSVRGHDSREAISGIDPTQWHRYGLVWGPSMLTWYVDGVEKKQMGNSDTLLNLHYVWNNNNVQVPVTDTIIGLNNYMFLTVEGHVGNQVYSGRISSGTQMPCDAEIDYVKAWDGNVAAGSITTGVKPSRVAPAALEPRIQLSGAMISRNRPLVITLSQPVPVKFAVHDLKGRALYSMDNPASGTRIIAWNGLSQEGKPLPAGIYLCKVSLANKSVSARVTLMP